MIPRYRPHSTITATPLSLEEFEQKFAQHRQVSHAIVFPLGRTAIQAFLENQDGVKQVAVAAYNCTAVAQAIAAADCVPNYVDCEADGFNADPQEFSIALKGSRAGIVVSQWGVSPKVEVTSGPLLFDRCLSGFDASVPTLREEDAVLWNFGWGKPLGVLSGAVLCTQSRKKAEQWKNWRNARVGAASEWRERLELSLLQMAFHPNFFGASLLAKSFAAKIPLTQRLLGWQENLHFSPGRMPSEALLGKIWAQQANATALAAERASQLSKYRELLKGKVRLPADVPHLSHFPVRVPQPARLQQRLLKKNIFLSIQLFDRLLSDLLPGRNDDNLMNARKLTQETLHLPLYSGLTLDQISYIVAELE